MGKSLTPPCFKPHSGHNELFWAAGQTAERGVTQVGHRGQEARMWMWMCACVRVCVCVFDRESGSRTIRETVSVGE